MSKLLLRFNYETLHKHKNSADISRMPCNIQGVPNSGCQRKGGDRGGPNKHKNVWEGGSILLPLGARAKSPILGLFSAAAKVRAAQRKSNMQMESSSQCLQNCMQRFPKIVPIIHLFCTLFRKLSNFYL